MALEKNINNQIIARLFSRGHEIIYLNDVWIYADNFKPINDDRPCKKCGMSPTKEGHDHCLGKLKGVKHACCGHGVEKGYIIYE